MSLFSKKIPAYLGVDIGAAGMKVVELRNDRHRPRLSTYGMSEHAVAPSSAAAPFIGDTTAAAEALKSICARAKVEATRAVASVPVASVFSTIMTLPAMPDKELPAAVTWEAKKLVPIPIEEMIMDWKRLPEAASAPQAGDDKASLSEHRSVTRVLLTGAPKVLVGQYLAVFKGAGLDLVSLETEAFALIRALVGDDPSTVCVLDIGAARSSIVIVDRATPVFSRSVDVGGRDVTDAIAQAVGGTTADAEDLKLDLAVVPAGNAATAAIAEILPSIFAPVVQEIRYALNLHVAQSPTSGRIVEKLILAGGSSLLPSLVDVFANALHLRVFVGDPWARIIYPVDLRPALDTIGPRFAVAAGLAMREIS